MPPEEKTSSRGETTKGTSILLRLPPAVAAELRRIAKKEERTITTIALRALRLYFKTEHNIDVTAEE
jgi:predicted transcriptional regulator